MHILLADFDIAADNSSQTGVTSIHAGTPEYMSPESVRGEQPTSKHDMWYLYCS